jgi:hypothetical protein
MKQLPNRPEDMMLARHRRMGQASLEFDVVCTRLNTMGARAVWRPSHIRGGRELA